MWLGVSGKYEKKFGMMELTGEGELELAVTVPDLDKVRGYNLQKTIDTLISHAAYVSSPR